MSRFSSSPRNLAVTGSLATIPWLVDSRNARVTAGFGAFFRVGAIATPTAPGAS